MTYVDASLNEGSENKVLRRLLWLVRQDLRSGQGKLLIEELYQDEKIKDEMDGADEKWTRDLVLISEQMKPLGRNRYI